MTHDLPWAEAEAVLNGFDPVPGVLQTLDLALALSPPFDCRAYLLRGQPPEPAAVLCGVAGAEREEALRAIARPRHKRAWLEWSLARTAARRAVWDLLEIPPEEVTVLKTPAGAPRLATMNGAAPLPVAISLAHVRGLGAAAAARDVAALGLDVELASRLGRPEPFIRQIAAGPERALVAALSPAFAAVTLWTLKEAAAKASGEGFDGRPESFAVTACDPATGRARVVRGGITYQARFRLAGAGAVALAWRGQDSATSFSTA